MGGVVHPEVVAALERTATLLREPGHEVVEAAPAVDAEEFSLAFLTILAAELRADIVEASRAAGQRISVRNFDASTFGLGMLGKALTAQD